MSSSEESGLLITGPCSLDFPQTGGDRVVSLLGTGPTVIRPPVYKQHDCNPTCNNDVDVASFRGYNPFAIPLFAGWSRLLYESTLPSNGKAVVYVAPCGRSIRNIEEIERFILSTGCQLTVVLFTLDPEIELYRPITSVEHPCFTYDPDISHGEESQPISIINCLDSDWIDPKFSYCRDRFPGQGVHMPDSEFASCCDCTDNCT